MEVSEWSASRPGRFTSRERSPGTRWTGCWVDPRAGLHVAAKRKSRNSLTELPRTN